MLCMNSYPKTYVDDCRSGIEAQIAAYRSLLAAAAPQDPAREAFDSHFFRNLILALDSHFVHRTRGLELKDGNPLNEVRMLASSIQSHHGVLCADKTIKYDPAKSVLKLRIGDEITLSEGDFTRLAEAFLSEIEAKYA